MKRSFLPLIIIICIAPVLMHCEKQEIIDNSKEIQWTTYTTSDGLVSNYVLSIAIDNEGNKWFGTPWGVSKFDGNTWTTYTKLDGLADNSVESIAIDKEGNKWFTTCCGGVRVSKFDGNAWTNYMISDGISLNNVHRIAGDKKGNMWFGTCEGVSKFDGKKWTNYRFSNYTISDGDDRVYNRLVDFAIDAQDILWVLREGEECFDSQTHDGAIINCWHWGEIISFDGKKWTTVYNGYVSGLSLFDVGSAHGLLFNSIVIDKENNKWLGTLNHGVKKLSD